MKYITKAMVMAIALMTVASMNYACDMFKKCCGSKKNSVVEIQPDAGIGIAHSAAQPQQPVALVAAPMVAAPVAAAAVVAQGYQQPVVHADLLPGQFPNERAVSAGGGWRSPGTMGTPVERSVTRLDQDMPDAAPVPVGVLIDVAKHRTMLSDSPRRTTPNLERALSGAPQHYGGAMFLFTGDHVQVTFNDIPTDHRRQSSSHSSSHNEWAGAGPRPTSGTSKKGLGGSPRDEHFARPRAQTFMSAPGVDKSSPGAATSKKDDGKRT